MAKYVAYPEYKDSGVEWLGELPAHWKMMRLKQTSSIQTGIAKGKDLSKIEDKIKVPYLRVANVQDGYLKLDDVSKIEIKTEELDRYRLQSGDMLMNEGGDNDKLGRGAIWHGQIENCIHQNHVFAVRPTLVEPEWLNWLTQAEYAKFHFYRVAKQSTNLASISSTNIGELPMVVPPEVDRDAIINFLDHETAKIDTLIEEQQSLIRLLKEKRQAVISHAVTNGLNPQAPMKDSGVEWLGEMPEHWSAGRLTYQVDLLVDGTHHSPESYPEGDYLYITAKNIKEHGFDFSNISYISSSDHKEIYSRCSVKKGDVLYIKDGATAGIATVNDLEEEFSLLSSVALIRPRKHILRSKYLQHHLNASVFKDEMLNRLSGGAMTRFTIDGISRFNILIPPLEEQDEIIEFIEDKSVKMDALIKQANQAISLMNERRTALISAAVTGKIDVRSWQAPTQPKEEQAVEAI